MSPEYLAGFFDGEGTFYLGLQKAKHHLNTKNYPKAQVMLSQSGEIGLQLLTDIQTRYGGNIYQHLKPGQHKATKAAYKIWWNKKEAQQLIPQLLPFLRIKKDAAQAVLNYLNRK